MSYKIKTKFFILAFLAAGFSVIFFNVSDVKADDASDCAAYCKNMGGTSEEMSACNKTCMSTKASQKNSSSGGNTSNNANKSGGGSMSYKPMENIPGFESESQSGDFPKYVSAVYKMGLWTIGICALLMIMIGGFMYITSAGNTSAMGTAKKYITDALIGVILAFTSYLLLYTINPELVKLPPKAGTQGSGSAGGSGGGGSGSGSGGGSSKKYGNGQCQEMTDGPCSTENLRSAGFGDNAPTASMICNRESGGQETAKSGTDICTTDGNPVSFGLFQCNISANSIGGLNCPSAFDSMFTAKHKNCKVTNQDLYNQCVSAATNGSNNIQFAVNASKGGSSWGPWKGTAQKCGI